MSFELTDMIFNASDGVGSIYKYDGVKHVAILNDARKVTLKISTWIGLSPGAVHFYGTLYVNGLKFIDPNGRKHNFMGAHKLPKNTESIYIELKRQLTKKDIDSERFDDYDIGDYTNTDTEIKDFAKKIFKKHFVGNWKLVIPRKGTY